MLGKHEDPAYWDELFAVVEKRLRLDDQRLIQPTAVLRLESAIEAAANLEICLSALRDLRAAMSGEVAARRSLGRRCELLEAALRDLERDRRGQALRAAVPDLPHPSSRQATTEATLFTERPDRVFGTHASLSLAVLRIGFDSFEEIVVHMGSAVAAQLLQIASSRIAHAVRSGDIVNRIDTDGFACVLLDLPSREQLTHLACKMIDLLSQPMQLAERRIALCPSIGIAMCPGEGTTPHELITAAGEAMCRAREQDSQYAFSNARAEIWASQFSNLGET
jgi:diguanylate cyclase (GGDEF)-like protein